MTALNRIDPADVLAGGLESVPNVYLFPGQIFTSAEPVIVTTILGSCVAVCLWDSESGVAGINHFLLPVNPMKGGADARYGNTAMERLLETLVERGASARRLVGKVVGGASVVDHFTGVRRSIGEQNAAVARDFLRRLDITINGDQTGGRRGRKLLFHTGTGSAFVKEI